MPRARPVHRLSEQEAELAAAIAAPEHPELTRARKLKSDIEAHWAAKGMRIVVTLAPLTVPNGGDQTRTVYAIQSETLNGWPVSA